MLALDGFRWERIERRGTTVGEAREWGRVLRVQAAGLMREADETLGIRP